MSPLYSFVSASALQASIYSHAHAIYSVLSPCLGPTPSPLLCPTSSATNEGEISSTSSRLSSVVKGLLLIDESSAYPERQLLTSLLLSSNPRGSSTTGLSGRDSDPGGGDGGLFFMLFTCKLILLSIDHLRGCCETPFPAADAAADDRLLYLSSGVKQGADLAFDFLQDERCPVAYPMFPTALPDTAAAAAAAAGGGSLRPLLGLLRAAIAPKASAASLNVSAKDVAGYFPSCLPSNLLSSRTAAGDDDEDDDLRMPRPTLGLSPAALSRSILRAHLSSSLSFDPPFIKSHAVPVSPFVGGPSEGPLTHLTSCVHLPATLLLDETYCPLPGHRPRPVSAHGDVAAALLFACSLDPTSDDDLNRGGSPPSVSVDARYKTTFSGSSSSSSSVSLRSESAYRASRLRRLCALLPPALAQVGATIVLCQRVVHPLLAASLAASGIRVVQRLGIRHVGSLAKLLTNDGDCGGGGGPSVVQDLESFVRSPTSFSSTQVLLSRYSSAGGAHGSSITPDDAGLLALSPYPVASCPAFPSTLVLSGRDPTSLAELKSITNGCLDTLRRCESSAAASPTIGGFGLAGGGCWEKAAAKAIVRDLAATGRAPPVNESATSSAVERRRRALHRAGKKIVGEALLSASLNGMRSGDMRSGDAVFPDPTNKWPKPKIILSQPAPAPPSSGYSGRHGHAFMAPKPPLPSRLLHLFYGWSTSPSLPGSAVAERISCCDADQADDSSDSEIVEDVAVDFLDVGRRKKAALEKSGRRLVLAYYGDADGKQQYPAVFERRWAADKEDEYFGDEGGFLLDCRDTKIRSIRQAVDIATTMLSLGGGVTL